MLKSALVAAVPLLLSSIPSHGQQSNPVPSSTAPPATVYEAPQQGTEAALRRLIAEVASGKPNYDLLAAPMAARLREQLPQFQKDLLALGQVQSVTFAKTRMQGADVFDVRLTNGALKCMIGLDPQGVVAIADCRQAGPPSR